MRTFSIENSYCEVCEKQVDQILTRENFDNGTLFVQVRCHGETQEGELSDVSFAAVTADAIQIRFKKALPESRRIEA